GEENPQGEENRDFALDALILYQNGTPAAHVESPRDSPSLHFYPMGKKVRAMDYAGDNKNLDSPGDNKILDFFRDKKNIDFPGEIENIMGSMMTSLGLEIALTMEKPVTMDTKNLEMTHVDDLGKRKRVGNLSMENIYIYDPNAWSAIYLQMPPGKRSAFVWVSPLNLSGLKQVVREEGKLQVTCDLSLFPLFLSLVSGNAHGHGHGHEPQNPEGTMGDPFISGGTLSADLTLTRPLPGEGAVTFTLASSINRRLNHEGLPFIIDVEITDEVTAFLDYDSTAASGDSSGGVPGDASGGTPGDIPDVSGDAPARDDSFESLEINYFYDGRKRKILIFR
ncbi:MAG: hypothetical protein HQK66_15415, partial [Desulfamplus sp.]|nr:hypothetical protein [Desulfamplus sp.]